MASRKKRTPEEEQRSRDIGRELADRINEGRARRGLPPDPRLEVALRKTWREMTRDERDGQRALEAETARALEERVAYWEARVARKAHG
jgi:hypothetical protein